MYIYIYVLSIYLYLYVGIYMYILYTYIYIYDFRRPQLLRQVRLQDRPRVHLTPPWKGARVAAAIMTCNVI